MAHSPFFQPYIFQDRKIGYLRATERAEIDLSSVQVSEQTFNNSQRPHKEIGWMRLSGILEAPFPSKAKGLPCRAGAAAM